MPKSVVFPAPFGPMSAKIDPRGTLSCAPRRASTRPKRLWMSRAERASCISEVLATEVRVAERDVGGPEAEAGRRAARARRPLRPEEARLVGPRRRVREVRSRLAHAARVGPAAHQPDEPHR